MVVHPDISMLGQSRFLSHVQVRHFKLFFELLGFRFLSNQTEREGVEPSVTVKLRRFSKPMQSTTLPPFLYHFLIFLCAKPIALLLCSSNWLYQEQRPARTPCFRLRLVTESKWASSSLFLGKERVTRFERATCTLARCRSTTELYPQSLVLAPILSSAVAAPRRNKNY